MKTFLSLLTIAALSASALSASSIDSSSVQSAGFNKLSESQKAQIIAQVEQQALAATDSTSVEKLDQWVDLGTKIGKGLAGAAKEAGVAVNEFAATPVGVLTTALIVWKIVGNMIFHFLGALLIWAVGLPTVHHVFKRAYTTTKYDKDGKLISKNIEELSPEGFAAYVVSIVVVLGTGVVAFFSF